MKVNDIWKRLLAVGIVLLACVMFVHPGITLVVIVKGIELGIIWMLANLICRIVFKKRLIDFITEKGDDKT